VADVDAGGAGERVGGGGGDEVPGVVSGSGVADVSPRGVVREDAGGVERGVPVEAGEVGGAGSGG
jgi:hypothetical protein